ncbi:hypothetical protein [Streptomyces sp. NPDC058867]|uniref:hypothetical protein n=1 Tax=unclassified Streptomyces TaxID=2593676 RepID=UPI0036CE1948
MHRSVRVLSALALGSAAVGFAGSAALAEPAAEVSPASVHPGGSVTVSVSCDPVGGAAPATLDATSQAFAEGTVALHQVAGNDESAAGPAYRGTARIAAAADLEVADSLGPDTAWTVDGTCPAAPGGQGKPWSATLTVTRTGGPTSPPCTAQEHRESCPSPVVRRGVHAGQGGAFTDSVPALVAGGLLIAGALGGAVYRLWRRSPTA